MRRCTAWPEHVPFLGLAYQPLWQVVHDDASVAPSFVIHSHLLDGIAASVCRLPPFLPASDPLVVELVETFAGRTPGEGAFTPPPGE